MKRKKIEEDGDDDLDIGKVVLSKRKFNELMAKCTPTEKQMHD